MTSNAKLGSKLSKERVQSITVVHRNGAREAIPCRAGTSTSQLHSKPQDEGDGLAGYADVRGKRRELDDGSILIDASTGTERPNPLGSNGATDGDALRALK